MNREDAKNAKEEERRMRQLGEQVEQHLYTSSFALLASSRFVKKNLKKLQRPR
ncbi:hypothetical protein QUA70_24660 [Microcoleus sp. LAD1_D5]|uniref:hypothetical protein n=1 Tax=unclassified Microcoleus TaxID=2642155 RepID=UPI002FD3D995